MSSNRLLEAVPAVRKREPPGRETMPRMIDQIRASKLPSNMMQFAARGALQVPAAENIEILVHLARHNKVFGDLARMTLAGWDEKACLAVVSDPETPREVLNYFISSDNLRPALLPKLLDNPSVAESEIVKLATSSMRDTVEIMLKSSRVRASNAVIGALRSNPYVKKEEITELAGLISSAAPVPAAQMESGAAQPIPTESSSAPETQETADAESGEEAEKNSAFGDEDAELSAYMTEHAGEIAAEGDKKFQAIGGALELLGSDYFPVTQTADVPEPPAPAPAPAAAVSAKPAVAAKKPQTGAKRENSLQKINALDIKGRIQLALKGNKEERSLLIRDGTKVVALAVLEAPKLSDGEVEKFASQKNVLEAVLRQIPLKRRFMKNYIVVRNLVANPRTPLDLGLGLMKNLLAQDLKNISANKEVSETIRKLALKMYKQKVEAANKK
jgi:hypothetical protein